MGYVLLTLAVTSISSFIFSSFVNIVAFSALAVATIIWSVGSLWRGWGSTVERYDKTGESGANLSCGISRAVFIQSFCNLVQDFQGM